MITPTHARGGSQLRFARTFACPALACVASLLAWMADQRMTQALGEQGQVASRRQAALLAAFGFKLLERVILHLGLYQGICSLTQLIQREFRDPNRKQTLLLQRAGLT